VEEHINRLMKEKNLLITKNIAPMDIGQAIKKLKDAKVESNYKLVNSYYMHDMPILKNIGSSNTIEVKLENFKKTYFNENFTNQHKDEKIKFNKYAIKIQNVYNKNNYLKCNDSFNNDYSQNVAPRRNDNSNLKINKEKALKKIANDKLYEMDKKIQNSYLLYNINSIKKKIIIK